MSERPPPAFQLYTQDFLASRAVARMSAEQVGAYLLLLLYCWQDPDCSLPDDDEELAELSRLRDRWPTEGRLVRSCFVQRPLKDGAITNPRLFIEREKLRDRRAQSVEAGKASAKSKARERRSIKPERQVNDRSTTVQRPLKKNSTEFNPSSSSSSSSSSSPSASSSPSGEEVSCAKAHSSPAKPSTVVVPVLEIVSLAESVGIEVNRTRQGELQPEMVESIERLWKKSPRSRSLDWWKHDLFGVALQNDFLAGKTSHGFLLTLGWITGPKNSKKVLAGDFPPTKRDGQNMGKVAQKNIDATLEWLQEDSNDRRR